MTQKQFFMKLDQLSSKPMTIERVTDFANTIILAYREDLYMYCLVKQNGFNDETCNQMYLGPFDKRYLCCYSSQRKAKLPKPEDVAVTGLIIVQELSVREVVDNMLNKDVITGLVFNHTSDCPYIVDKEVLEPFVRM